MLRPNTPLFQVAEDLATGNASDAKLTLGQQLKSMLSSKETLSAEIITHKASIAAHEATITARDAELVTARAEIATLHARVATLEADAAEVTKALGEHQAEVAALSAKEQSIEKRAEGKSKETLSALGFPSNKLPGTTEQTAAESGSAGILARFQAEKDPDSKAALYQDYRAALAAESSAKK